MRHKYATEALVLARYPQGEASSDLFLLTPEFGIIRARAQGLRRQGAKLASALQTFSECEAMVVRGKDIWRLSGASLTKAWAPELPSASRVRAGRVASLMLRLIRGEGSDAAPFVIFHAFLAALPTLSESDAELAECLAALRVLKSLGLDAGEIPGSDDSFDTTTLQEAAGARRELVMRVNRGITASGL